MLVLKHPGCRPVGGKSVGKPVRSSAWRGSLGLLALLAIVGCVGCGGAGNPTPVLTRAELMDPAACQTCHPQQFGDWSQSMHAYAADDPVFQAMNQRGQRETNGALGDFCLK